MLFDNEDYHNAAIEPDGFMLDPRPDNPTEAKVIPYYATQTGPIPVDSEEGKAEAGRRQMERDEQFTEKLDWFGFLGDEEDDQAHKFLHNIVDMLDSIAQSSEPRAQAAYFAGIYRHHHFVMHSIPQEMRRREAAMDALREEPNETGDNPHTPWRAEVDGPPMSDDEVDSQEESERRKLLLESFPVCVTEKSSSDRRWPGFCSSCGMATGTYHHLDCGKIEFDELDDVWRERTL